MKFNFFTLTTLFSICFLASSLSPTYASHHEGLKGGSGHHNHGTPSTSNKPGISAPVDDSTTEDASATEDVSNGAVEAPSEMDGSHAMPVHEGHGEGGSEGHSSEGGATHHGHGEHSGIMGTHPWFHHGAIEVSDVSHPPMTAHAQTGTEVGLEDVSEVSRMMMPSLTVMVHPDANRGWNLEVQTENFTFAPEQVNQANQPNVGHGHLYINGEKITRVYSNWLYLGSLDSGTHEITVSLHANGHEVWTHEGEAIAYTTTIDVP